MSKKDNYGLNYSAAGGTGSPPKAPTSFIIPKGTPIEVLEGILTGEPVDIDQKAFEEYAGKYDELNKKIKGLGWPKQCFRLSSELIDSVSEEELNATFADMEKLGIANDPYDEYDIRVPEWKAMSVTRKDGTKFQPSDTGHELVLRYQPTGNDIFIEGKTAMRSLFEFVKDEIDNGKNAEKALDWHQQQTSKMLGQYRKLLIVLLGTRNIVKEIKRSGLARLGIGKSKKRYEYTTTLKIGRIEIEAETETASSSTGIKVRPHLRRGHIRNQRFGPNNELKTQIWIKPVFVNADQQWIGARTAYNVSLTRGAKAANE